MAASRRGRRIALLVAALAAVVLGVAAWRAWPHLRFWWLFEPLGKNAQGYPEYRHRQTGIVFVRLPGGTVEMGSSPEECRQAAKLHIRDMGDWMDGDSDLESQRDLEAHELSETEGPRHPVSLSPFLIAKYEVSQAAWKTTMGSNPSFYKALRGDEKNRMPVEEVSWQDALRFCDRHGFTLPTEAQWEYACRAGTRTLFAFGDALADGDATFGGGMPADIDSGRPNGFGLHNAHGNLAEWCLDVYDPAYYSRPEASGPDPLSLSGSEERVRRGGGFNWPVSSLRSAARSASPPNVRYNETGFRPACPLP